MTAADAPHWLAFSEADFDASRAPRCAASKRAAHRDQAGLFFVATPVTGHGSHRSSPSSA